MRPAGELTYVGLRGVLHRYAKERPVTVEEMGEAVQQDAAEKFGKRRR